MTGAAARGLTAVLSSSMRARILALVALLAGCAPGPSPRPTEGALEAARVELREVPTDAPRGTDAPPRLEVVVHPANGTAITRDALAAVRFAGGAAYVDTARRLVAIDRDGAERVLASEIAGRPVADASGARLAWTEPRDLLAPELRTMRAGDGNPTTIAVAPGALTPLAFLDEGTLALVGSANGGVAGLWLAEPRGGGALVCVTNCALRAAVPWGAAYVPPPGDATSLRRDGDSVRFVAADGSEQRVLVAGGAR